MSSIIDTTSALPKTVDGTVLDHNCLHCQLALPVQHFMDRHPEKSRAVLINEVAEVLAELIASAADSWTAARSYHQQAVQCLDQQTKAKFEAYARMRAVTS